MGQEPSALWVVVLAGGAGRRLSTLTDKLYGVPTPKQYAVLGGNQSLLQQTVARMSKLAPPDRIVVVVQDTYEPLAREQLSAFRGIHVLAQPSDRGTAIGVALPLAWIRRRQPRAKVLVTPSDHYVARDSAFDAGIRAAEAAVPDHRVVLLGVRAERPETEYGWILREPRTGGVCPVIGFVEKPEAGVAAMLHRNGALWNTFVLVASVAALWQQLRQHLPRRTGAIEQAVRTDGLRRVYESIESADFSRDVLQRANRLGVVEVRGSGWSDWGTPERVFASLQGTDQLGVLKARLGDPLEGFGEGHGTRVAS